MKRNLRAQADYRSVMLRNQLTSLVLYEAITTTRAKAKELTAFANHFFHRLDRDEMNSVRLAHETLFDKNAVKKVFEEILPRYSKDASSYLRVLRVMPRKGDSADMRLVTLQKPLVVKTAPAKESAVKEPKVAKAPAKKAASKTSK